jgi:Nitrile hydratase beta subunit, N-terminal
MIRGWSGGSGGVKSTESSYYERWIVAFANILFQKQILMPEELARKMDQVKARWSRDLAK